MKIQMEALAEALVSARRKQEPLISAPWEATVADAADAYVAQDLVAKALGWFDQPVPAHWKSGAGSRAATLTHAPLHAAGVRVSPADFGDLHFNVPGIESEIALRLGQTVTPQMAAGLTHEDAGLLVDAMTVSIEIVDSRWLEGSSTPPLLKLADSQSHGALVLGEWVPYARRDWAAQTCETRIGDREPDLRTGAHPLGEPAWLLPIWLEHATRHGDSVPAGTVVTTGSWVGILPIAKGEAVSVEFPGIGRAEARL